MHASLVCIAINRKMGATSMSDFVEILNPQSMTARLYFEGEVVEEYKIEQCDKCSKLTKFDPFGYQIGYDRTEKIIWFCGGCR
jgi:hypothetical protein